jgi:ketosteroid isomerase-like protein
VSDSDIDVIRGLYKRLTLDADEATIQEVAHPEIEWIPPPQSPIPGPFRGIEGVLQAADQYRDSFDQFTVEPERIIECPEEGRYVVLARTTVRGKGSGAEVATDVGHLVDVRDGMVVRFQVIPNRDEALRAAGLDPGLA